MKERVTAAPIHIPVSTYRIRLNRFFPLERATEFTGYLAELGVGDCHISPVLRARRGSLHGYDVTDHGTLNPEIGTVEQFQSFAEDLRSHGMGLLLDIVPNHMCISDEANREMQVAMEWTHCGATIFITRSSRT